MPLAHAMGSKMGGHLYILCGSTTLSHQPALPQPITDVAVATIGRTTYLLGGISSASLASITIVSLLGH